MSRTVGFDNAKYLQEQAAAIRERLRLYGEKLYLEFGGKLLFDYHAARVLPGYDPNVKMRLLRELQNETDIVLCIHAGAIERKKMRADFGITYDADVLKMIDDLREWGLDITAVVITRYDNQPAADGFKNKLERRNIPVYTHRPTKGYPTDVDTIVSPLGYGANPYIRTTKPLVVVTAPGPGSGKLATCLSMLYHDHLHGVRSGYSKFETFPIWNLPLSHPVNIAYEAATADLRDFNLIDPFHLEVYKTATVNYNRDVEVFPVVRKILERITGGKAVYQSPTDMGVNRAGFGIIDDAAVRAASCQEIIRRYFRCSCEYAMGMADKEAVHRVEILMDNLGLKVEDRMVVCPARQAATDAREKDKGHDGIFCGAALELADGRIITGKNSPLLHASSSLILNASKALADLPDKMHLLSPAIIESVTRLKTDVLKRKTASLDVDETLIALSICATTNPAAQMAMEKLKDLRGCETHLSHIPAPGDEAGLRRLGVNLTSDPCFSGTSLFTGTY